MRCVQKKAGADNANTLQPVVKDAVCDTLGDVNVRGLLVAACKGLIMVDHG